MAKTITEIPLHDRPYEKLELLGPNRLTNSELLAIMIKTGTTNLNCLQIAQNILGENVTNKQSDLEYLMHLSLEELKQYEGIGRKKAILIQAVLEFSKRISSTYEVNKDKITSPKDVYNLLSPGYLGQKQECLKTIILNKQNMILGIITNAIGSNDKIEIGIKEILSEPIKYLAHGIILVHNHPAGSLLPSHCDLEFTKRIQEYANIFNIKLLDHVIIANHQYVSLKELGKM